MKTIEMYTIEDIKKIEVIDPRVSKLYVPIYSSELIELLSPEFSLVKAQKLFYSASQHYVDLINKDNDTIRIYNSYDRGLAFRMSLLTDSGFSIDLGTNRIIHRGENAKGLYENIKAHKEDIIKGIKNAKILSNALKNIKIRPEFAKVISDIIFSVMINSEGYQEYTNYVDVLIGKISVFDYISYSIEKFIDGDYTVTNTGKKRNGRKTSAISTRIVFENRILSVISKEYPEYFL